MIVDAHAHVGVSWPEEGVRPTVADAIAMMDRAGVDAACTSASRFLRCDMRAGNRVTQEAVRQFPDRLFGFVVLSPREREASLQEADRYLGSEGFRGIKIHRSHNSVDYDDSRYDPIYAKGQEYLVPVLAHTFSPAEVGQLVNAARRFPAVSFIVGHSGDTPGPTASRPWHRSPTPSSTCAPLARTLVEWRRLWIWWVRREWCTVPTTRFSSHRIAWPRYGRPRSVSRSAS